ncbi:hypothetical protein GF367_02480 [Candidatus Woesearchaeota archaeon]|nr:hypothetical protein [Candidatus Woesearchaeota archaeon]
MMKAAQLMILFLLIIAAPVIAELSIITYPVGDAFSVSPGAESIALCQCEPFMDQFVIRNSGRFTSKYMITFSHPELVSLSETSFELLPGETKVVYLFINAPCGDEFSKDVTFRVDDLFGNRFVFEKTLEVGKCQNLEASLSVSQDEPVMPCTPVTYEVLVENTGVFTETYELWFGGERYDEYFDNPYQTLILPPEQSGVANATMTLDCALSGDFAIPFHVAAEQNELAAELSHDLTVLEGYDYFFGATIEDVCAQDVAELPVTIRNDALFSNDFSLWLEAPTFFSLEKRNVTIAADEEEVIMLTAAPGAADAGNHTIGLHAQNTIGGVRKTITADVIVNTCYGVSINVDVQEHIVDCAGYREYPVLVENTGTMEENVTVAVAGSPFASFEQEHLVLGPGQTADLSLVLDIPAENAVETVLQVRASVDGKDVVGEDTIAVSFVDEYACYQPGLAYNEVRLSDQAGEFVLVLANNGLDTTTYDVAFDGPGWLEIDAATDEFWLAPGERANVTMLMYQDESDVLGRYEGSLLVFVESVDDERVLTYVHPFAVRVHGQGFVAKVAERCVGLIAAYPCQFVSVALLALLVAGVVYVLARPQKRRRRSNPLLFGLLGLWLLAVAVFLLVQGLPPALYEPVEASDDPLLVRFAEDTSYELNMSQYFVDPDDDLLSFTVSDVENVFVAVRNDTAVFVPEEDWVGTRRFRITAYDGFGGVTESSRLSLEVVDRVEYTCWSLYSKYCGYVNLVLLLALVFVIWLVAMLEVKEEPPAPKRPLKKRVAKKMKKQ